MKVDTRPFLGVNMVEGHRDMGEQSAQRRLDFSLNVNMASSLRRHDEEKGASPHGRPQKGEKKYITEEQVRHVRYQRPLSAHLLKKYEYQYRQRHQYVSEDEEYEHRTRKNLKKREDSSDHWHCPFFKHCWNSGMSRLPTINNCPECGPRKHDPRKVSVFQHIGPMPPQDKRAKPSREENFEGGEDKYHQPRWCPHGLSRSQKRRVQRLCNLEEVDALYLEMLRKVRPDLAVKVHYTQEKESRPRKKE
jgi:rubrerythrin